METVNGLDPLLLDLTVLVYWSKWQCERVEFLMVELLPPSNNHDIHNFQPDSSLHDP